MWKCHNCQKEMKHEAMFCDKCEEEEYLHCELCGVVTNKHQYNNKIGGLVCLDGCKEENVLRNKPYISKEEFIVYSAK